MGLFDFSKMKKVATDGKTTTFEHEKGHRMVILHSALPRIQQEQIKRLALYRGGKVKKLAEGTPDEPLKKNDDTTSANPPQQQADLAPSHDTHITINAAPAATPPPPAPPIPAATPTQIGSAPATPSLLLPDKTLNAPAAVGLQQKAIAEQVPISAAASQATAKNEQEYVAKQQEIAQQQQQHYNEIKSHTDEFNNYIKQNPINPRAYQESQTSGQKTQTAIGLLLGGLGGGGTSNIALDFLNKQIDRDISAQQKNADNRQTVWGAYQHLYDDSNIATNLAKVSANDILVHKTNLAAANLGSAQAAQRAHELEAQKAIENNQLLLDASGRLGTLSTGGHKIVSSISSKSKSGPSYTNTTTSILAPGASLDSVKFNPTAKQDYDQVKSQFTQAQQSDKTLKDLDRMYNEMDDAAGVGAEGTVAEKIRGVQGYAHRMVGELPYVGAATDILLDTPEGRTYDRAQTGLRKAIKAALPDMGDEAIHDLVKKLSPERGDSKAAVEAKKKELKDFIIKNTKTSLLDQYNLTNK